MQQPQLHLLQIEYEDGGTWHHIPQWALNFAQLGAALHNTGIHQGEHLVVALALPVRDWAVPFLILGYLLAAHQEGGAVTSAEEHFRRLMNLPCGTPVKLIYKDLQYEAQIAMKDADSIDILYKKHNNKGKLKRYRNCKLENCFEVHLIKEDQFGGVRDRGRLVSDSPDFLSALLPDGDVVAHCLGSRVDYIIVGDVRRLREEVFTSFMCREKKGCLQDALRIRNFSKPTQGHCGLVKAAMSRTGSETTDEPVGIVIHDSAAGYLRHHSALISPTEVILLDRSERTFAQAAQDITTRFACRLQKNLVHLPLHISDGVETIAFLEARGT